ncbi:MAG: sulfatase [Rikenellaceae bacterium]
MTQYTTLLSLASIALLGSCTQEKNAAQRPLNIVLINLDDAGNGDFSHRGAIGYQTPHIDSLAANGMSMTNFYAAQPISGASRAGLMTGCYPNRIGFAYAPNPNCETGINPNEETIAELLKDNGYATAIFGKWHLGDAPKFLPLQNGFDEYYGLPYSNDMWPFHPQWGGYPDIPLIEGNEVLGYNTDQSQLTTDYTTHAVDFIERQSGADRPFFLYLAHSMPHVPLAVSDKFKGKSKQGLYGDVMMELDWSVGEVLDALKRQGIEENTLIIITSDNGPWANYGNHAGSSGGLREAKATTFNGGMRVPCIFYWKGQIEQGSVSNDLMTNIDILPTIVELAGASAPKLPIDGESMVRVLKGEVLDTPVRSSFAMYYHKNSMEAITDGSYKLVFPHKYVSYDGMIPGNDGQPGDLANREVLEMELYDLRRDPGERTNIIEQHPAISLRLQQMADSIRVEIGDDLTGVEGRSRREVGRI